MRIHRVIQALLISASLYATTAFATFTPPRIVPSNPTAGTPITLKANAADCDGFSALPVPVVTVSGNVIDVTANAAYNPFCFNPPHELTVSLGTFGPGTYTARLSVDEEDPLWPGPPLMLIGSVTFTVTGTPMAVSVPAVGSVALIVLSLGLTLVVGLVMASRRRRIA